MASSRINTLPAIFISLLFIPTQVDWAKMRVAIIGQSQFAGEVYKLLQKDGHKIAGVFTIPDVNGRADALGMYKIAAVELWVKSLGLCSKLTT